MERPVVRKIRGSEITKGRSEHILSEGGGSEKRKEKTGVRTL